MTQHGFGESILVEAAMRIWRKDPGVFDWLARFAAPGSVHLDGDTFAAKGPSGVVCGFRLGDDPITSAVQLGMFLAGPYWPHVWPGLLERVNREWKRVHRLNFGGGPV